MRKAMTVVWEVSGDKKRRHCQTGHRDGRAEWLLPAGPDWWSVRRVPNHLLAGPGGWRGEGGSGLSEHLLLVLLIAITAYSKATSNHLHIIRTWLGSAATLFRRPIILRPAL